MGLKGCFVSGHHLRWTLTFAIFVIFASTDAFVRPNINRESPLLRKDNVGEIVDILKVLEGPDNNIVGPFHKEDLSNNDQEENLSLNLVEPPRTRKSGTTRPKYDPGLKWIGLGKRPSSSAPLGPELFTDLRRFFNIAQKGLLRRQEMNSNESSEPYLNQGGAISKQEARRDGHEMKFVTRSKSSGGDGSQKKHYYNPSILWTGLGR